MYFLRTKRKEFILGLKFHTQREKRNRKREKKKKKKQKEKKRVAWRWWGRKGGLCAVSIGHRQIHNFLFVYGRKAFSHHRFQSPPHPPSDVVSLCLPSFPAVRVPAFSCTATEAPASCFAAVAHTPPARVLVGDPGAEDWESYSPTRRAVEGPGLYRHQCDSA